MQNYLRQQIGRNVQVNINDVVITKRSESN
jgi:hypothetical protein